MRANTRFSGRTFSPRNRFASNRFNRFDRFNRFHHHRRFNDFDADDFFFNNCFNTFGTAFGCSPFFNGFGFGGFGFDPFFDYSSGYQQPQQQPVAEENGGNDREVAFEVQALRDEIQSMHDEQRSREVARSAAAQPAPKDDSPNAILVFRDGIQLPVRNYAIAGDTIWVLDKPNQKISMAKLDIPATKQANEKNGLDFHLPQ